jgi:glyoxylase-like metal-dependent hydrolase (beta-lactamase superfamily II)
MKVQKAVGIGDSNVFIVETDKKVFVIDAGAPTRDTLAVLDGRKPSAIFLTHEHFDHVMFIGEYCDAFNCPVYCNFDVISELRTNELNGLIGYSHTVSKPKDFDDFHAVTGGDTVECVTCFSCPGHSAGSMMYLIGDQLFTGDVLFTDTIGRTDLMENGDELMQQTLQKIQDIKFTTAHHGHYESSNYNSQHENILAHIED